MPQLSRSLAPGVLGLALTSLACAAPDDDASKKARSLLPTQQVAKQIDRHMRSGWKEADVKARPQATDAEFLRRVSLDLVGSIPTEESVRGFLRSKKSGKRAAKVRELLASPAYGRTQGLRWAYQLVGRKYLLRSKNISRAKKRMGMNKRPMDDDPMGGYGDDLDLRSLDEWLAEQFTENTPWNDVARRLISASGKVTEDPATHYMLRYARDGKAAEVTGNVMRVFQGQQIQCSQCHDDPDDRWTQRQFWGLAAFFSRTKARRTPPPPGTPLRPNGMKRKGPFRVFDRPAGQIRLPAAQGAVGALVLPRFITGEVINPGRGVDRRAAFAKFVTREENPWFAKATVNRVWSHLFGRGLTAVDDLVEEDSAHPEVLTLLAEDFAASGYDMRRLTEIIALTKAYGLTSAGPVDTRDEDLEQFARAPLRSLSAEQVFTSVLEATGVEDIRSGDRRVRRRLERMKFQLLQKFLRTFGDDDSEEVVDQGTIPEALMLLNGPLTNDAVRPRVGHPVYDRLFRMRSQGERIETIYLRVLGRTATRAESKSVKKYLKATQGRGPSAIAQAYADIFWALLNSAEFNLIH